MNLLKQEGDFYYKDLDDLTLLKGKTVESQEQSEVRI